MLAKHGGKVKGEIILRNSSEKCIDDQHAKIPNPRPIRDEEEAGRATTLTK